MEAFRAIHTSGVPVWPPNARLAAFGRLRLVEPAVDVLLAPWSARSRRRNELRGGAALTLGLETWGTLIQQQELGANRAVER